MNKYNCLDLDIIKKNVASFASIAEAKEYILNEQVIFNPLRIKQNCIETSEALKIIGDNINVQFSGIESPNAILDKADKKISLDALELKNVLVFHNHCERIFNIFKNIDSNLNIKDYTDSLVIENVIFDKINNCIDNSGQIKEDATSVLKNINEKIESIDKTLYSRAEQFISKNSSSLQETSIYSRDNRLTFLIKNSDKNKFGGYAYGNSASGLATYVEPAIFIDLNNEKIKLIHDKQDEIDRILKELTFLVSTISDKYRHNFDSLLKLNVIFSKANYGLKNNGIIPSFVDEKYFDFKDLCHPLLDFKTVVSNSYRIYEPFLGIVISGSNTGGKTVSLKAIGLSILMSYLGIPIVASSASIPFYKYIYVDIDDNQSIQDSLSTFSAHITNINNILNHADDNSLILIDELISGTDPKEAQAISLSILDKIKEIGSIFVITTHFDDIKNYSYNDEKILLSSVGFDFETLKPTYKYHENSIGSSNALEIASRYFDDENIVENAKKYLKEKQSKQDELIETLSKQIEEEELRNNKLENLIEENNTLKDELNNNILEFENEKKQIYQKYIQELHDYIEDIKNKAKDKIESINNNTNKTIIKEIDSLKNYDYIDTKSIDTFSVGDFVRINNNEQIGQITDIKNDNVTINLNGITIKTNVLDLTKMPKVSKKSTYVERPRKANIPREINLIGQRVEDGVVLMEKYLNDASLANHSSVKIIHGIGTGALRSALREKLKKIPYVKSFKDGDFYDGGSAVTIVDLK